MNNITVILPAYNEEKAIGSVIDEINSLNISCSILVGNNSSSDHTKDICVQKGIIPFNIVKLGKGNVIRELIQYVNTPYTIMVDSDYTYPILGNFGKIYELLVSGSDVVICNRKWKDACAMSATNRFGNWCLSLLASLLYGYRVYDVCTGLWGFRTETLRQFTLRSEKFTLEAELFVNSVKSGSAIKQFPIHYRARLDNTYSKLKLADGFRIAKFLIMNRF